jgi:phosphoribosylaminoimidazole carboxylase (NCAIR synthetase)
VLPAPHLVINSEADIDGLDANLLPGILKTARMGYDGKGQVRVRSATKCARFRRHEGRDLRAGKDAAAGLSLGAGGARP